MQETLYQTADARVSILEPRCKRRVEGIGMQRSSIELEETERADGQGCTEVALRDKKREEELRD